MLVKKGFKKSKRSQNTFKPDFYAMSASEIDFEYLKKLGVKAALVDLDGTVVERGQYEVLPSVIDRLKKTSLKIYIATNRPKSRELKNLRQDLSAVGVIHPNGIFAKPSKRYYRAAIRETGLKPHELVMVGDRFLQDIYGANRCGIYSLMVQKLGKSHGLLDKFVSRIQTWFTGMLLVNYTSTKDLN